MEELEARRSVEDGPDEEDARVVVVDGESSEEEWKMRRELLEEQLRKAGEERIAEIEKMRVEKEAEVQKWQEDVRRVEEMDKEVRKREGKDRVLKRTISDLEAQNNVGLYTSTSSQLSSHYIIETRSYVRRTEVRFKLTSF